MASRMRVTSLIDEARCYQALPITAKTIGHRTQDGTLNSRNEVPSSPDQSSDPNPDRPVSATTRADLLAKCRVLAQAAWEKALGSDHEHFTELATFYLSTSVEWQS